MSDSASELPADVYQQIVTLSEAGDALADEGDFAGALESYWAAWDLLPAPESQWVAATWLLGAIGDANFLSGDYEAGRNNLSNAMHCPDAVGNPFLHLRLGQCQLELGDRRRAADELARAYAGAGAEIFSEEDSKYFKFLQTVLEEEQDAK